MTCLDWSRVLFFCLRSSTFLLQALKDLTALPRHWKYCAKNILWHLFKFIISPVFDTVTFRVAGWSRQVNQNALDSFQCLYNTSRTHVAAPTIQTFSSNMAFEALQYPAIRISSRAICTFLGTQKETLQRRNLSGDNDMKHCTRLA